MVKHTFYHLQSKDSIIIDKYFTSLQLTNLTLCTNTSINSVSQPWVDTCGNQMQLYHEPKNRCLCVNALITAKNLFLLSFIASYAVIARIVNSSLLDFMLCELVGNIPAFWRNTLLIPSRNKYLIAGIVFKSFYICVEYIHILIQLISLWNVRICNFRYVDTEHSEYVHNLPPSRIDGGTKHLWKVSQHLPDYTVHHSRKQLS
jgi:hypothetical protein